MRMYESWQKLSWKSMVSYLLDLFRFLLRCLKFYIGWLCLAPHNFALGSTPLSLAPFFHLGSRNSHSAWLSSTFLQSWVLCSRAKQLGWAKSLGTGLVGPGLVFYCDSKIEWISRKLQASPTIWSWCCSILLPLKQKFAFLYAHPFAMKPIIQAFFRILLHCGTSQCPWVSQNCNHISNFFSRDSSSDLNTQSNAIASNCSTLSLSRWQSSPSRIFLSCVFVPNKTPKSPFTSWGYPAMTMSLLKLLKSCKVWLPSVFHISNPKGRHSCYQGGWFVSEQRQYHQGQSLHWNVVIFNLLFDPCCKFLLISNFLENHHFGVTWSLTLWFWGIRAIFKLDHFSDSGSLRRYFHMHRCAHGRTRVPCEYLGDFGASGCAAQLRCAAPEWTWVHLHVLQQFHQPCLHGGLRVLYKESSLLLYLASYWIWVWQRQCQLHIIKIECRLETE